MRDDVADTVDVFEIDDEPVVVELLRIVFEGIEELLDEIETVDVLDT